jgi:hypothetical protein
VSTPVTTVAFALALLLLQPAPAPRTFAGVVTDSECPDGDHASMRMGDTAAECAKACRDYHAATLVLYDGTRTLRLDDQKAATPFAGQKVTVVGTLDDATGTIAVKTISLAK